MVKRSLLFLFAAALACSTPSSIQPLSVPMQYKMMASPAEFSTFSSCAAISSLIVTDTRIDKALGKRFIEGRNAPAVAVTTTSDVAVWARGAVEEALKRGGVKVGEAGAPALHVTVEQVATSENVLHRSGYEGRVALAAELKSSGQTAACWRSRGDGFAQNYGYSGSIENYQETLNHALDRAVIRLFGSPELKDAVCEKCRG